MNSARRVGRISVAVLCFWGCCCRPAATASSGGGGGDDQEVVEWVYQGGLASGWEDWGWAKHGKGAPGPQHLNMASWAGWTLVKRGQHGDFGGLTWRFSAPAAFGDFLQVKLRSAYDDEFPRIKITGARRRAVAGRPGWFAAWVSIDELNPDGLPFDRIRFEVLKSLGDDWVQFDRVGFTERDPARPKKTISVAGVPLGKPKARRLAIRCEASGHRISPMIFGVATSPRLDSPVVELGATAARWGGNASSRYNWKLGNAWNSASDWFFRNTNYNGGPHFNFDVMLDYQRKHGLKTALTVPMIGWVAKDTESFSFPTSVFGQQQKTDNRGAGNGKDPLGGDIEPGPPTRTSVAAPPSFVAEWVRHLRERDQRMGGARSIDQYILDNEPMLWNTTHRDVHPEPVTYDELLRRSIDYAAAVRRADPQAVIAGPALWGWTAYFYSAADGAAGWDRRPDRRAHGDVPLLAWYLSKMREHHDKTGERLLDVVDVHFYPQARGVDMMTHGRTDPEGAALRLRSTRALWDASYRDESWIKEEVRLLPRLREWIDANYPGLGISIGEYNFGAEQHISGGLALAEALGRFAEHDVTSAFYWRYPDRETPAFWAFRAYRNYDGAGAHFLDYYVPSVSDDAQDRDVSLFASRDEAGDRIVAVALNLGASQPVQASLALEGCGVLPERRVFVYVGGKQGFQQQPDDGSGGVNAGVIEATLAPYSMTIFELRRAPLAEGAGAEPSPSPSPNPRRKKVRGGHQETSMQRREPGGEPGGEQGGSGEPGRLPQASRREEGGPDDDRSGRRATVYRRLSDAAILERAPRVSDGWCAAGELDGGVFVVRSRALVGAARSQQALPSAAAATAPSAAGGQPGWLELSDGTFYPAQAGRAPIAPYVKGVMTDSGGFLPSSTYVVW